LGSYRKTKKVHINENDIIRAGVVINSEDIDKALEKARADHSDSIGAPKVYYFDMINRKKKKKKKKKKKIIYIIISIYKDYNVNVNNIIYFKKKFFFFNRFQKLHGMMLVVYKMLRRIFLIQFNYH